MKTEQENPGGLHKRYIVSKANGEPVDPRSVYFVLRLDGHGDDMDHIKACRVAAWEYALYIRCNHGPSHPLYQMAKELSDLLHELSVKEPTR